MIVHDIPDLQQNKEILGSVVFSESFLESSINIQQKGEMLIWLKLIKFDFRFFRNSGYNSQAAQIHEKNRQGSFWIQWKAGVWIEYFLPLDQICDSFLHVILQLCCFCFILNMSASALQMALCPQTAATQSWLQLCLATPAGWYVWCWESMSH